MEPAGPSPGVREGYQAHLAGGDTGQALVHLAVLLRASAPGPSLAAHPPALCQALPAPRRRFDLSRRLAGPQEQARGQRPDPNLAGP